MHKRSMISGFDNRFSTQEFTLTDGDGRPVAAVSGRQGRFAGAIYNGSGNIIAWATTTADGKLDIRIFDENGEVHWRYPEGIEQE